MLDALEKYKSNIICYKILIHPPLCAKDRGFLGSLDWTVRI